MRKNCRAYLAVAQLVEDISPLAEAIEAARDDLAVGLEEVASARLFSRGFRLNVIPPQFAEGTLRVTAMGHGIS